MHLIDSQVTTKCLLDIHLVDLYGDIFQCSVEQDIVSLYIEFYI